MGFVASAEVERLDFDFSDVGGPTGVVPEPADDRVRAWSDAMREAAIKARLDFEFATEDPAVIAEALLQMDSESAALNTVDAYAQLCGGDPPARKRPEPPRKPQGTLRKAPEPGKNGKAGEEPEQVRQVQWDPPTAAQLRDYRQKLDKYRRDLRAWELEWTGGAPTRAELGALPYRHQRAFMGWLTGVLSNPEAASAATTD